MQWKRGIANCLTFVLLILGSNAAPAQEWSVKLRDINDKQPRNHICAESTEFLPNAARLVTAGLFYDAARNQSTGEVRIRSATNGTLFKEMVGTAIYVNRAGSLAVSPKGDRIAAAGRIQANNKQVIDLFDPIQGKHLQTLKGDPWTISAIKFSPNGRFLASAHFSGVIEFWDHKAGTRLWKSRAQGAGASPIAFTNDGKRMLTTVDDGGIVIWNTSTGKQFGEIAPQPDLGPISSLVLSPNGKYLACAGLKKNAEEFQLKGLRKNQKRPPRLRRPDLGSPIYVYELDSNREQERIIIRQKTKLVAHHDYTYSLSFSPDSKLLAVASQDTTASVWDIESKKQLARITEHTDFVYDVAFSPDGKQLATLGRDSIKMWSTHKITGRQKRSDPQLFFDESRR